MNNATCTDYGRGYYCYCATGYVGVFCETDINECLSNPCQNMAICNDEVNDYSCTCVAGYTGDVCENEIKECDSSPCINFATCTDLINTYNCTCVIGYTGINCETDIDDCSSNTTCSNYTICLDEVNGYRCECEPGYSGEDCDTEIDECGFVPCMNSGTCSDEVNGYNCTCHPGYTGVICETDIDECTNVTCQHGGNCNDLINGYTCSCVPGYTGNYCETEINDCVPNPCANNGTCTDLYDGYYCSCTKGYKGVNCTEVVSTPAPTTTATDLITQPPPDDIPGYWSNTFFSWNLSFIIDGPYENSPEHEQETMEKLRSCFNDPTNDDLGYKDIDEQSIDISAINSYDLMETQSSNNPQTQSALVKYSVLYYADVVLVDDNTDNITNFINDTAMESLIQATFANGSYGTNDEYIDYVIRQQLLPEQTNKVNGTTEDNFCGSAKPECPDGYNCANGSVSHPCKPVCYYNSNKGTDCCSTVPDEEECEEKHKSCDVMISPDSDDFTYVCGCDEGYTSVFGRCLSVWVMYTILTVAVIAIVICVVLAIVLCAQKPRKRRGASDSREDDKSSISGDKKYDTAKSNVYCTPLEVKMTIQTEKSSPVSVHKTPRIDSYHFTHNDFGYSSVEPASSSSSDDVSVMDIPIELQQSVAYRRFQANLAAVDTSVDYFPNRPSINIKSTIT